MRFNYPTKKEVEVLKGVTIEIKKNRVVALVGPSGNLITCNSCKVVESLVSFQWLKDSMIQMKALWSLMEGI